MSTTFPTPEVQSRSGTMMSLVVVVLLSLIAGILLPILAVHVIRTSWDDTEAGLEEIHD